MTIESGDAPGQPTPRWMPPWDVVKFILGTIALSGVTLCVNTEIQHRELELKEQEHIAQFLTHALEQDLGRRKLFAEYFASMTSSDKLRDRWERYLVLVDEALKWKADSIAASQAALKTTSDGAGRDSLIAEIQRLKSEVRPTPPDPSALRPRVYIHISADSQRASLERLATTLRTNGLLVPGIELKRGPNTSELRYFRSVEAEEAEAIAELVRKSGMPSTARYIGGHEASTRMRPRHFELWISPTAK